MKLNELIAKWRHSKSRDALFPKNTSLTYSARWTGIVPQAVMYSLACYAVSAE